VGEDGGGVQGIGEGDATEDVGAQFAARQGAPLGLVRAFQECCGG